MKLEKAFSDAAFLGYDYIELWGGRPHGTDSVLILIFKRAGIPFQSKSCSGLNVFK